MRRSGPSGDGIDRLVIAGRIGRRVLCGARRLAQHVEGKAIALRRFVLGVGERIADGLAEHELAAENAHRLAQRLADHRLAAPPDQALDHSGGGIAFALAPIDDAAGQHQTVSRGVDEQRARLAEMPSPIAAADGSGDQPVGGGGIGDAQQSLGKAEQQHAFAAGQTIFMQEGVDTAGFAPPFPRREHQPFGNGRDLAPLVLARPSARDQRRDKRLFVAEQRLVQVGTVR